jgi:hypothetical protein
MSFLCTASYPSPSRENATIPRSSLVATALARALPSHSVSPVLFQVGGTIPPSFLSHPMLHFVFLRRSGVAISTEPWQRVWLVFQHPDVWETSLLSGLSAGRNYPVCYGRIPVRDSPSFWSCRLCGGRVKRLCKRPVASIVWCLLSGMRRRVHSIVTINHCLSEVQTSHWQPPALCTQYIKHSAVHCFIE